MKTILLALICYGLLLDGASVYAQWDEDAGFTAYSRYKGKKYASSMPSDILNASPDFDTANATLPKSIKVIIDVAYSQLEKVTGSKKGWKVQDVSLHQSNRNEKKWFYSLSFTNLSPESIPSEGEVGNISVTVTVDGRLGVIKEIQERKIE
jgi:hypothetical protein